MLCSFEKNACPTLATHYTTFQLGWYCSRLGQNPKSFNKDTASLDWEPSFPLTLLTLQQISVRSGGGGVHFVNFLSKLYRDQPTVLWLDQEDRRDNVLGQSWKSASLVYELNLFYLYTYIYTVHTGSIYKIQHPCQCSLWLHRLVSG